MPLVRIDLSAATRPEDAVAVSNLVHEALVKTFDVPAQDRFHTLHRRTASEMVCTPEFLGIQHSAAVVFVQITCSFGRSLETKKALFSEIAHRVATQTSIGAADVIINLLETNRENWSFGQGGAQYAV